MAANFLKDLGFHVLGIYRKTYFNVSNICYYKKTKMATFFLKEIQDGHPFFKKIQCETLQLGKNK